jgi:hypothetical protein
MTRRKVYQQVKALPRLSTYLNDTVKLLGKFPTESAKERLGIVIKHREHLADRDRARLRDQLRGLAKRFNNYADQLESRTESEFSRDVYRRRI